MIECGQYNEMWPDIHMFPEETVKAGIDVNAKKVMPIHWGAFKLAMHSWTDPVERFITSAEQSKLNFIVPKIGGVIYTKNTDTSGNKPFWFQVNQ